MKTYIKIAVLAFFLIFTKSAFAASTCKSNDDCPNKKPCIGVRKNVLCSDNIINSECISRCPASATTKTYAYYTINKVERKIDMECMRSTILAQNELSGFCQIDSITEGLCNTNKLLKGVMGRYLIAISVISMGIMTIITGKVEINKIMIMFLAICLIFGSLQILNIITGVDTANVCT